MNFYKRYIGDYQRDTGHLSVLEHGAYTLLLDAFYATERPLPENKNTLYRLVRANTKREREAVDFVLSEFWSLEGGKWLNRRALTEIEKASAQAETNRRIAVERETNRSTNRSTKRGTNRSTKGQPIHSHSQTTNTRRQTPEPKPQPKTSSHEPPVVVEVPPKLPTSFQSQTPPYLAPSVAKNATKGRRAKSFEAWKAYALAYQNRYGVDPTRNARVNGQMAQFIQRVPLSEAPAIAQFYVRHNDAFYIRKSHPVGSLLADAEKLRTEWRNGMAVTGRRAQQDESTATNFDNAERAIEILERRDREREKSEHRAGLGGNS